jgi:protein-L-isoaspartate(D-aspartate) O-methyltransferase
MRALIDMPHQEQLRRDLVKSIEGKGITDQRVLEVMGQIPRQFFMPGELEKKAYEDKAFPIGEEQSISQPYTVAYQSQLLDVRSTHRVLEIGTGSAYQAVILAELAKEVYSIERQIKLYNRNGEFPYLKMFSNLHLYYGDGYEGLPQQAPFDRILVTAAAPTIPPKLLEQLAIGGKMVLPLGKQHPQKMVRITKAEVGQCNKEVFDQFCFVPMLEGKQE